MIPNSKIPVNITKQKQHLHLQGPAGARVAERPGEEEESGGTPPRQPSPPGGVMTSNTRRDTLTAQAHPDKNTFFIVTQTHNRDVTSP